MLITQLVIITRCSTRCPREERTWVLVKDSWSAWPGRSSGRPRWEQRWKQPSKLLSYFQGLKRDFRSQSGFCLGAGVRRGNRSCWPWDRWPDPVDYKGRVPRMVCRLIIDHLRCHEVKSLCVKFEYLFSSEVLPSETYFFLSSTIITIAHRLNTVLDYDRILVLKEGAIAELDTPRSVVLKCQVWSRLFQEFAESWGRHLQGDVPRCWGWTRLKIDQQKFRVDLFGIKGEFSDS